MSVEVVLRWLVEKSNENQEKKKKRRRRNEAMVGNRGKRDREESKILN